MSAATLTDLQKNALRYMAMFLAVNHQLPTGAKMAQDFGWSSANAAHEMCERLEAGGWLQRNELGNRMLSAAAFDALAADGTVWLPMWPRTAYRAAA